MIPDNGNSIHMNQVIITDDNIGIVVNINFSRKNNVESNSFRTLMTIISISIKYYRY